MFNNHSNRYQLRENVREKNYGTAAGTRRALGDISNNATSGVQRVTKQFSDLSANSTHRPSPPVSSRAVGRPTARSGRVAPSAQNWVDIDAADAKNPQACVAYVNEIYEHFFATEGKAGPKPSYITKQADINEKMRAILIDWLVEWPYLLFCPRRTCGTPFLFLHLHVCLWRACGAPLPSCSLFMGCACGAPILL